MHPGPEWRGWKMRNKLPKRGEMWRGMHRGMGMGNDMLWIRGAEVL